MLSRQEKNERAARRALRSDEPYFNCIEQFVLFLRAVEASYADGIGLQSVTQGCLERAAAAEAYGCCIDDKGRYRRPEASLPLWVRHAPLARRITRGINDLDLWYEVDIRDRTLVAVAAEAGIIHQRLSERVAEVRTEIMRRLGNEGR